MIAMVMWWQWLGGGAALALGLAAAAAYAGLETGAYVLNKARLELRAARSDSTARYLARLVNRPEHLLSVTLIATNAAQYLVTSATVLLFTLAGSQSADLYTILIIAPTLFVLCEMLPKNVFRLFSENLTYRMAWVLYVAEVACRAIGLLHLVVGFAKLMSWLWHGRRTRGAALLPRQRVRSILAEGHAHGVLTPYQSSIADRVIEVASTTVRQVMVPLGKAVTIPVDCSRERFIQTLAGHNYSRLPLWRDRPGNIVGVVNIYDVLFDTNVSAVPADHVDELVRLPDDSDVGKALVTLQREHQPIALVVDASGRAVGIATIKDLVEEIVGELAAW